MKKHLKCRLLVIYKDEANLRAKRKFAQDHILTVAKILSMEVRPLLFEQILSSQLQTDTGSLMYLDCYFLEKKDLLTGPYREYRTYLKMTGTMLASYLFYGADCLYQGYPYKVNFSYK